MRDGEVLHRAPHFLGQQAHAAGRGARQHHRELFAAEAGGQVGGARAVVLDHGGHAPQHVVAGDMAVGIVVGLEGVDIDHHQRQLRLLALRAAPFRAKVFVEVAAVGQPGEAVRVGQALQFQVGLE
ncbi:hypothetical protein D3C81_1748270 [compost metagenome]